MTAFVRPLVAKATAPPVLLALGSIFVLFGILPFAVTKWFLRISPSYWERNPPKGIGAARIASGSIGGLMLLIAFLMIMTK
jgi:hypothetical protein